MKKTLFLFLLLISNVAICQTILSDNFDSYNFPGTVIGSVGTIWDTWSENGAGTFEDALLSNVIFSSADLSAYVTGDDPGGSFFNDLFLKFPDTTAYTSGTYEFKLNIYVEAGFGGYFNLGGAWAGYGLNHDIGARVFFNADGTGQLDIDEPVLFNYNLDDWNNIRVSVDLDAGTKALFVNGNLITADDVWDSPSGFALVNVLGIAFNTFGLIEGVPPGMYIDDIELINTTIVSTNENINIDSDFLVYPSPSKGQFTVEFNGQTTTSDVGITITDMAGRLIASSIMDNTFSKSFDLNVPTGIYLLNVVSQELTLTRKIVINN